MKILAYLDQTGFKQITPLTARHLELKTVYSRHPAGQRLPMNVNRRGSTFWFAYKAGTHQRNTRTEPETLTHSICKTVLKELADEGLTTQLKLTYRTERQDPIPVTLTSGQFEHPIEVNGNKYLIDTFCTFTQETGDYLRSEECKWQGKIAFEFFHTSSLALNKQKCLDLERIGIPIIQIAAREGDFLYLDEQQLFNKSEEEIEEILQAYRQKIRNTFKKQIIGVLFNRPESAAFREAQKLYGRWEASQAEINRLNQQLQDQEDGFQTAIKQNKKLTAEQQQLLYQMDELQQRLYAATQSTPSDTSIGSPSESSGLFSWLKRLLNCLRKKITL